MNYSCQVKYYSLFLACVLSLFWTTCLSAQSTRFERLGAVEGLSQGMIYDLLQDRKGFMWFATKDGLNRYDGYSFEVFQSKPFDRFSISDNEILALLEDHLGRIWVGTLGNGLSVLDPTTGKFYHLTNLLSQNVYSLAETTDGLIWAGTANGVNSVRIPDILPENGPQLESIAQVGTFGWDDPSASGMMPIHRSTDITGSRDGKLWVSTYLQIGYYEPKTGRYQKVWSNPQATNGEFINSFLQEGPDGSIWVGQPAQILRIRGNEVSVFRLPESSTYPQTEIVFDASGNLFAGTRKQIYRLPANKMDKPESAEFELFYRFPSDGIIGSTKLTVDRGGLLWIGTNGYGLLKYNPGNPQFHHYLNGNSPRNIIVDPHGNKWIRHTQGLFQRLDETENKLKEPIYKDSRSFQHDCTFTKDGRIWLLTEIRQGPNGQGELLQLNGGNRQPENQFQVPIRLGAYSRIHADKDGLLWITGNVSTLARFDPASSSFKTYDFSGYTGFQEASLSMHRDVRGHLWIGTPHGLIHAIPQGDDLKFILIKNNPNDPKSLNCNAILTLLDDPVAPDKYLWIGTKGGGLNLHDKRSGVFSHFTTAEGLPNNVVYGILPENLPGTSQPGPKQVSAPKVHSQILWLSTNRGLSRFDPAKGVFQNYFGVDGLQDDEFNTLSFARATDGQLYFGGVNGISAFHPEELNATDKPPPLFITRLKINNQTAQIGKGVLEKCIEQTQAIKLDHTQNQLTFEFAALDFSAPRMNQFRYRLIGADQHWVESTTDNSATYASLNPGRYVFEVITGGSRGIWNGAPVRLEIQILPPWWQSGWAYLSYGLILILGIWAFSRFQTNKIRLKNKLAFEHQEALRLAELDRLKTNFFSSVTHEFRTPLTLLLEPARQLLAETKDRGVRYRIELIEKNAQRLLHFVNQLLDLSKIEAGQMPLDLLPGNPCATIHAVSDRFQPLAKQRLITLKLELPEHPILVNYDAGKWDQIGSNLLANALKFTDKGGTVTLKMEVRKSGSSSRRNFRISVSDTGVGIEPSELPRVFDRFYQTEHARGGSGIGLSLTRELVERMGGKISVTSILGSGSTFLVDLPCELSKNHPVQPAETTHTKIVAPQPDPVPPESRPLASAPLLLLIEDDTDLRHFLRASLPPEYRIAEAADGAEGIQMALELIPDLVISDLAMPHKNGYEVTETLKNDLSTSHIPLILLTAKTGLESKIQGLRRGADVYLTKPFRSDELVAHIENLLASRQRMQDYFSQAVGEKSVAESVIAAFPEQENEFLQRLIQVVEDNLDNEHMDAEGFAKAIFISRSQLHRKISALTGLSLTEFIRNHRLDRARKMLAQREGSITEIAWRTGFPNAKYFSTCFKERFGVTPSGFMADPEA